MKVAIVGLSPSTIDQAPWGDDSWQKWGMAWSPSYWSAMDRLFEMHDRPDLERRRRPDYWERLASIDWSPVYMQQAWSDIPASVAYPLDAVTSSVFAGFPRARWTENGQADWYNCSPAYMMALALHEGAESIGLWAIDVNDGTEHAYERPCLEYLIGLAVGRGVEVIVPEGPSDLGRALFGPHLHNRYPRRYGYVT